MKLILYRAGDYWTAGVDKISMRFSFRSNAENWIWMTVTRIQKAEGAA